MLDDLPISDQNNENPDIREEVESTRRRQRIEEIRGILLAEDPPREIGRVLLDLYEMADNTNDAKIEEVIEAWEDLLNVISELSRLKRLSDNPIDQSES